MPPKTTSFPRQDIRVLLLEGISQTAVEAFRAAGYTQIEWHPKALPDAELKVYKGGSHGICTTHKHQINDDLLAFIQK